MRLERNQENMLQDGGKDQLCQVPPRSGNRRCESCPVDLATLMRAVSMGVKGRKAWLERRGEKEVENVAQITLCTNVSLGEW